MKSTFHLRRPHEFPCCLRWLHTLYLSAGGYSYNSGVFIMESENQVPSLTFEECGCMSFFVITGVVELDPENPSKITEYYLVQCNHYQRHWIDGETLYGSVEEDC